MLAGEAEFLGKCSVDKSTNRLPACGGVERALRRRFRWIPSSSTGLQPEVDRDPDRIDRFTGQNSDVWPLPGIGLTAPHNVLMIRIIVGFRPVEYGSIVSIGQATFTACVP
jgi:hypothetical protein